MSRSRATILGRVRHALQDVPKSELSLNEQLQADVVRNYQRRDEAPRATIIEQFVERVTEYKATVRRVDAAALTAAIEQRLRDRGVGSLVVPADLPAEWQPENVQLCRDSDELSYAVLGESDGVITGCAVGIAQTGTIVLDHGQQQGRRALSLIPDYHLCLIRAEQIVGLLPEAMAKLAQTIQAGQPITFISGPSATSDIELNRVEGVHGPRTLDVLVVD